MTTENAQPTATAQQISTKISTNTSVTLGVLATVLMGVAWLVRLDGRLANIETRSAEGWTITQQSEYAARVQISNPNLHVPDPRNPGRFMNENAGGKP